MYSVYERCTARVKVTADFVKPAKQWDERSTLSSVLIFACVAHGEFEGPMHLHFRVGGPKGATSERGWASDLLPNGFSGAILDPSSL